MVQTELIETPQLWSIIFVIRKYRRK